MWKEKYKIGVETIDAQHEELFKRVTQFIKSIRSEGQWEQKLVQVKETLNFMQEYVVFHFNDEEEYQRKISFPGFIEHKKIHDNFKAEVLGYAEKFEKEGFCEDLVQEFAGKLLAWLINHVAAMDQKIGQYMAEKEDIANECKNN
jgi:hemerythrin